MKNNLPQTLLDVLARCRQALTARGLSLTSRKLYLSDIKNFLTYLESSSRELNIASLSSPSSYRQYLAMIESKGASRSTLNRSLAALRQLGSIVSESYSVQDPTSVLSLSGKPSEISAAPQPFEEYIKAFTNYLTSQHLSLQTIKSYKSDVIQYLQWAVSVSGSNNVERVLTQNLSEKYLNHLYKIGNTAGATLERKNASIVRFHDWLHHTYPTHTATDNIANVISEAPKYIKTYQNTASDLPSIQPVKIKKTFKLPQLPSLPSLPALNFATAISGILIFVLISGMGFFGYRQLASDRVLIAQAYPTSPVTPNRQLSFQGRLESSTGTPITSATNFIFKLWNDPNAGSELYTSGTCSITPDTDGVFATQIGSTCGSAIPSSVFSENSNVYLEVTVGAETLTPRQQIATVAYALNSETLQGLPIPATMSAVTNSIVAMNQWGEIVIGEQSPTLRGVSGTLQISAPSVTITTLSNGNIVLDPNGSGIIDLSANTTVTGTLTLPNSSILTGDTTYLRSSRGLAFGANETYYINSSGTGNLNALTLTGDLTVTGDDIYMNTNTAGYLLIADGTNYNPTAVSGDITINSSGVTAIGADKVTEATLKAVDTASDEECLTYETTTGDFEWQACDVVSSSNWRYNLGTLSPNNDTVDLLVGGNATSSAKAAFLNINSGTPTASVSAGTNGAAFLTADGYLSTTARQSLTLGNSASFNTTGNTLINPNGTGNVGIGTTNPESKLHISGSGADQLYIERTSGAVGKFRLGLANANNNFWIYDVAQSAARIAINENGNVGVGTTGPDRRLDVLDASSPQLRLTQADGTTYADFQVNSSGDLIAGVDGTTSQLVLDNGGNIGIGTATPGVALDIVGNVQNTTATTSVYTIRSTGNTTTGRSLIQIIRNSGTDLGWDFGSNVALNGNDDFTFREIGGTGDTLSRITIKKTTGRVGINTTGADANLDSLATSGEQLRLTHTDGSVYSGMTLDSSGNLTIDNTGTKTVIADDLQITGDDLIMGTNTSGMLLIADGTNYNPTAVSGDITINSSGVTAIGADKVTEATLKAVDTASDEECLTYETTTGDFEWQTCGSAMTQYWRENLGSLSPTNDTMDLLIGSNATASAKFAVLNVNSGTPTASVSAGTNGAAFLTADGYLSTTARQSLTLGNSTAYNTTGNTLINPNGTGYVGIGLTAPTTNLEVADNIRITGLTPTFKFNETDNVEWQYIVGGDQWVLQRSGTDRMVVNNAGTLIMKGDIYNNEDTTVNIGASASNSNLRLFSNNSANAILTTEGYFGIGTLSPLGTFDVRSKLGTTPVATISGTTAMASLVVDQSGTGDIITASASGATKFVVKTDGSILASSYVDKDNTAYYLTPAATGTSLSIDGNIVSNGAFSITSNATDGDITINPGNGSVIIGGAGKLNATTVDPPYTINGEKFATYMAGMTGVKEETTGTVVTTESSSYGYQTVLDFANAPSGSDLWLFAKTTNLQTNIDQLVVLLSAMGNTKTWYNIDREAGKVYIYSSTPTTISYRLTAPRFDYTDWSNSRRDSSTGLVINDDSTWSNSSAPTIAIPNYTIELDQVASDSAEVSYSLKDSLGNVIRELVTASNAFIANLTAGSIKTQELASPLISTDTLLTDSTLTIKGTNSSAEPLVKVEGEIEAATVSARTAKLAEIVTNKLYAQEIIAGKITAGSIDGLDAKIASLAATTSELTEGELMTITDHIKARLALLTGNEPSAADIPVTQESTTSITLPAVETVTNNTLIASDSATLSNFTAANLTVSTFLTVTGHSILTDVTVTDRLSTPIIESTCSTEIIDCIPTLDIQPAGGIINLASGTLIIDSTGEVAINGNLTVTGQILTSSIDTGSLSLGNTPIDATSSALGKLLAIYNENGQQVATIDASGSANLASVTTQLINIAGASAKSSDSTAGTSTLEAGMTELTITNSYVDVNSLIYITPTTDTANQVLYVANKSAGSFTVAVRDPTASNITFNWWIIGTNPTP